MSGIPLALIKVDVSITDSRKISKIMSILKVKVLMAAVTYRLIIIILFSQLFQ